MRKKAHLNTNAYSSFLHKYPQTGNNPKILECVSRQQSGASRPQNINKQQERRTTRSNLCSKLHWLERANSRNWTDDMAPFIECAGKDKIILHFQEVVGRTRGSLTLKVQAGAFHMLVCSGSTLVVTLILTYHGTA